MNAQAIPPLTIAGHSFARDRGPVDCPIRITTWRWRWNCSCGAAGTWHAVAGPEIYRGWYRHATEAREYGRAS